MAQGLQFSDAKDLGEISMGHPQWGTKYMWGIGKLCDFQQIPCYIWKTVQDRCLVSVKGEQAIVCTLSNGDIANDLM